MEAKIAMHLAIHGKMATSTCLIKCLKSCLRHEDVKSPHLARTKCTAVVKMCNSHANVQKNTFTRHWL